MKDRCRSAPWLATLATAALAGCASVDSSSALQEVARWTSRAGASAPTIAGDDAERERRRERSDALLAAPLTADGAVEIALQTSPALQAALAEGWMRQAEAARRGALPGLTLSFERVADGAAVSITRMLAIGLAEWVTLPMRRGAIESTAQAERLDLARRTLSTGTAARAQWVRAVAAQQLADTQRQLQDTAEAGAELARRMQAVGNFSRTQRAREQAILYEAAAARTRADLAAARERESLVRLLGLDEARAARLRLPDRLPELPAAARDPDEVARAAMGERLDLLIAQAHWQAARRAGGPARASLFDAELAAIRESATGGERARGFELALRLPLDASTTGQAADAAELAAAQHFEQARIAAGSVLRERYAAYRAAHELALHQRDRVLPLRKMITDEAVLRYNGMLIGVFELLADARAQAAAVAATIEAQRDFALAEVALEAALLGVEGETPALAGPAAAMSEPQGGH